MSLVDDPVKQFATSHKVMLDTISKEPNSSSIYVLARTYAAATNGRDSSILPDHGDTF